MLAVLCCWLSWPFAMVMQSGGRKLTYIVMVPVCNFHVECGHCTVKQTYENVLNNVVKVATGSWVLLAISYIDIRLDFGLCDGGNVNRYVDWIHISMYHNWWYNCYVCCPWIRVLYSFQHWEQNPCQNRTHVSVLLNSRKFWLLYMLLGTNLTACIYCVGIENLSVVATVRFSCLYNLFVRETIEM
jgi:hypothetical protein